MNLSSLDLGILLAYLAGVLALGLWMGRKADSAAEFMVGGRDLPWWVILASIVATETSTVTFLSIPGFAFDRDISWLQIALGFLLGRFVVVSVLLPAYFRGSFFTAYQVLHQRFGGATQRAASAMFIVTRSLADGLRLFLSAIVLQELAGMPLNWAIVVSGLVTIAYCYVGGMRAVLWTDFVQFLIYIVGAVVALIVVVGRLPGGFSQLWSMGEAAGKFHLLNLKLDFAEPFGLWAGLVGGVFITLGSHGVDQMMVQRYLSAKNLGDAKKALGASGFVIMGQFALFLLIGVGLFCFYQLNPPAVPFDRPDRVFARFILAEMPVGVVGLLLGALFAAAMSTLSSSLNSCATAAVKDLWQPLAGRVMSEARELRLTRLLTAVFGLVQIAVGIAGQWLEGSVINRVLGIAGLTTGIVLGVFFLGMFATRVGQKAALVGLITGLLAMGAIYIATPLAWPWYALVGSSITFVAGRAASLVWERESVPQ